LSLIDLGGPAQKILLNMIDVRLYISSKEASSPTTMMDSYHAISRKARARERERELIYPKEMKLRKAVLVAYLSYLDVSE